MEGEQLSSPQTDVVHTEDEEIITIGAASRAKNCKRVPGFIGARTFSWLLDSGAELTLVKKSIADLGKWEPAKTKLSVCGVDGGQAFHILGKVLVRIRINREVKELTADVVDDEFFNGLEGVSAILGADSFFYCGITLTDRKGRPIEGIGPNTICGVLGHTIAAVSPLTLREEEASIEKDLLNATPLDEDPSFHRTEADLPIMTPEVVGMRAEIHDRMRKNKVVTAEDSGPQYYYSWDHLPVSHYSSKLCTDGCLGRICVKYSPYPLAGERLEACRKFFADGRQSGLLKKNHNGRYAAPLYALVKRVVNGKIVWRFVADFSKSCNRVIADVGFPLPRIRCMLWNIAKCKYGSVLDLFDYFHQCPIDEESQEMTGVVIIDDFSAYNGLGMGINASPGLAQKISMMIVNETMALYYERALGDDGLMKEIFVIVAYIDDFLIVSETLRGHYLLLCCFTDILGKYRLLTRLSKVHLFMRRWKILSHVMENGTVRVDPKKIKKYADLGLPTKKAEVQGFIGVVNYFGPVVPDRAILCGFLNDCIKERKKDIVLTPEAVVAYRKLVSHLDESATRTIDWDLDFIIFSDKSDLGLGGGLAQGRVEEFTIEGKTRVVIHDLWPVFYHSRRWMGPELGWTNPELELAAFYNVVRTFDGYICDRKFYGLVDHSCLETWVNGGGLSKVLDRGFTYTKRMRHMMANLTEYRCVICIVGTKMHTLADFWSRLGVAMTDFDNDNWLQKDGLMEATGQLEIAEDVELISGDAIPSPITVVCEAEVRMDTEMRNNSVTVAATRCLEPQGSAKAVNFVIGGIRAALREDMFSENKINALADLFEHVAELNVAAVNTNVFPHVNISDMDPWGAEAYQYLVTGELPDWTADRIDKMKVDLEKMSLDECGRIVSGGFIVPSPMDRYGIIYRCHRVVHDGVDGVISRIHDLGYDWPSIRKWVKLCIADCQLCPRIGKGAAYVKADSFIYSKPERFNEAVAIDAIGPLPEVDGMSYIEGLTDIKSRYQRLFAKAGTSSAENVRGVLDNWIYLFGPMERLICDGGPENKRFLIATCDELSIRRTLITPYNSRGNTVRERGNREILDAIKVMGFASCWPSVLKRVEFALNTRHNSVSSTIPLVEVMPWAERLLGVMKSELDSIKPGEGTELMKGLKESLGDESVSELIKKYFAEPDSDGEEGPVREDEHGVTREQPQERRPPLAQLDDFTVRGDMNMVPPCDPFSVDVRIPEGIGALMAEINDKPIRKGVVLEVGDVVWAIRHKPLKLEDRYIGPFIVHKIGHLGAVFVTDPWGKEREKPFRPVELKKCTVEKDRLEEIFADEEALALNKKEGIY